MWFRPSSVRLSVCRQCACMRNYCGDEKLSPADWVRPSTATSVSRSITCGNRRLCVCLSLSPRLSSFVRLAALVSRSLPAPFGNLIGFSVASHASQCRVHSVAHFNVRNEKRAKRSYHLTVNYFMKTYKGTYDTLGGVLLIYFLIYPCFRFCYFSLC